MKLRIKGSSLRLRLTQGEISSIGAGETVEERVPFAANVAFTYRLRSDAQAPRITAAYAANTIDIRIPAEDCARWCGTDLVSLAHDQPVPGGQLRIVLEKDFACLAPREGEDESDNFPHPRGGQLKC